tara:strand:+ start:266 stop:406 length:141 start_codon:yes stop_codon:yes gene_type:complete
MPKYVLHRPKKSNYEAKVTYDKSKQITRLENKINELRRIIQGNLGI